MRTFVVKLRNGEQFRLRAGHLYYSDGMLQVVVWDEEFESNRSVALFPLSDVQRVHAEEVLLSQSTEDPRPLVQRHEPLDRFYKLALAAVALLFGAAMWYLRSATSTP
jgi:hypothetical protein